MHACSTNLGFSVEIFVLVLVWGTSERLVPGVLFFFQAEDGIRDRSPSRGLGDVYKRQINCFAGVVIFPVQVVA